MRNKKAGVLAMVMVCGAGLLLAGVGKTEKNQRILNSPQYSGGIFVNPNGVRSEFFTNESWTIGKKFLLEKRFDPRPTGDIPFHKIKAEDWTVGDPSKMRFAWLGHSSILIAMEGALILADPVFGKRVSPFDWMGPERFSPPPVTAAGLPPLDVVLITHDHYDHLERPTIIALKDKTELFIVPLGIGDLLLEWGVRKEKIVELDWWESHKYKTLNFTATPAVHYAGRGLLDFNKRLWVSWAINGGKKSAFISGDSGYFDGFKKVGEKLGPFDVAFLKIGAYSDEGTWRKLHMTPEEAVAEFLDLRGGLMVPHHWATYDLGLHPWKEPMDRVVKSARELGVRYATPLQGEVMDADLIPEVDYWWRRVK
jgi:L-ascorbate metabolism protein UlaG (beta-lactamase superfamily)